MPQTLILHPDCPCDAVTSIEVDVQRPRRNLLSFAFTAHGTIGAVRLPHMHSPRRGDELWKHTCFEAFVRAKDGAAYCEFNFAPSLQWAAYSFDSYRANMQIAKEIDTLRIEVDADPADCRVQAFPELDGLQNIPDDAEWQIALAAVIEETNGRLSYWALSHAPGTPDFHHPDGFALAFPAPN